MLDLNKPISHTECHEHCHDNHEIQQDVKGCITSQRVFYALNHPKLSG